MWYGLSDSCTGNAQCLGYISFAEIPAVLAAMQVQMRLIITGYHRLVYTETPNI